MFEIQTERTSTMSDADTKAYVAERFEHVKNVLSRLGIEPVEINDDGLSINIRSGEFALDPVIYWHTPPAIVRRQRQSRGWFLTQYTHIPGRFNPYDGGYPPDVAEKEIGIFADPFQIAREILTMDVSDRVDTLVETMEFEQYSEI